MDKEQRREMFAALNAMDRNTLLGLALAGLIKMYDDDYSRIREHIRQMRPSWTRSTRNATLAKIEGGK